MVQLFTMDDYLDDDELLPRTEPDRRAFVPTLAKPLPSFQCTATKKDGERCERKGLMGMKPENAKCPKHGGGNSHVKEAAAARCDAARLQLTDNVELAVDTLKALMGSETGEATRLKAATEVLDRTIGKAPLQIEVTEEVILVSAADQVKNRLNALLKNKKNLDVPVPDEDIVDAEVIEETDE